MTRTLGLIPARGGSKAIPRKNILPIAGKPLIAWAIEAARGAGLDAVVVSTEDAEIAAVAREWGAEVPFMRPSELAADDTPGIEPVLDAIARLPGFETVLLLQPTSPLRSSADITGILARAAEVGAPAAVSVVAAPAHPNWMYHLDAAGRLTPVLTGDQPTRRQELPALYVPNGALYLADTEWLRQHRAFVTEETIGYVMPAERSVDIDEPLDWKLAELLLHEGG